MREESRLPSMTDVAIDPQPFRSAAPLQLDRALGWQYFTEQGPVYERDGVWYLTSVEAIRFAHQHPEIFSSAKAFESLGSPVPLIPLAIDPPNFVPSVGGSGNVTPGAGTPDGYPAPPSTSSTRSIVARSR